MAEIEQGIKIKQPDSNKGGDVALIIWTCAASTEPIRDKVSLVSLPIRHRSYLSNLVLGAADHSPVSLSTARQSISPAP